MNEKEIMSEKAFKELIDNLEIVEKLTPYGRKAIKYWVNKLQRENEEKDEQIEQALKIAFCYGQTDGDHHKAWVIDQMVRNLTGEKYDKWINDYIYDEETGDSYTWDKGIAP